MAVRTASEGHHAGPTHVQRPGDLLLLAASEQEEEEEEETRGAAAAAVEAVREERARRREAKKANRPICEVAPWASLNLVGLNLERCRERDNHFDLSNISLSTGLADLGARMKLVSVWKETANLLYWTMLAACTVGPGTVVTCARAGSEYDLSLIWALLFASVLAFTLQEGTARLTIISGKSLGQCLRVKYKSGAKLYDTALVCWLVAGLVCVGNTLYECNNWAGGIDAVFALPELHNSWLVRVAACTAYGNSCVLICLVVPV